MITAILVVSLCGGTGRRAGFKIPFLYGSESSILSGGTIITLLVILRRWFLFWLRFFVHITSDGTHSYLRIDTDGGADNFIQIAQISNVTGLGDEEALETTGTLITA